MKIYADTTRVDLGLKPCPFCGADANDCIQMLEADRDGIKTLEIKCCGEFHFERGEALCKIDGTSMYEGPTVVEQWNRRAKT